MNKTHRVNVNFTENTYNDLHMLANRRGKTISNIIRDAIAFETWFLKTLDEGGIILVERNGKAREIVRR